MKRTDYIIMGALLAIILVFGYLVASSRYHEPTPYHIRLGEETTGTATVAAAAPPSGETLYHEPVSVAQVPEFGKRDVFRTIIPKPTPEPTRAPTPMPPPNLEQATRTWKLESAFGNRASFRDTRTNAEFSIELGKTRVESYRGREIQIKLAQIDMRNFSVTLTFENQKMVKKMFE
jgi:hypothetical protein